MLQFEFDMEVQNCAIRFDMEFDLTVSGEQFASANLNFEFDIAATANSNYGFAILPPIRSIGGEIPSGYGCGNSTLPAIVNSGSGGFHIPPPLQYGFSMLPPIVSYGTIINSAKGDGSSTLPAIQSKGGEGPYGEGSSLLPVIRSIGYEGPPKNVAHILSCCYLFDGIINIQDHIVFINEIGQIVDSITGARELIASILASIQAHDSYAVIGQYIAPVENTITGMSSAQGSRQTSNTETTVTTSDTGTVGETVTVTSGPSGEVITTTVTVTETGGVYTTTTVVVTDVSVPSLDDSGVVWVVNIETSASGQYENYGFDSWFDDVDGVDYGLADDGIYELDAESDAGADIEALIQCGKSNLGTPNKKGLVNVYSGVSSTGKMILKVDADGAIYYYEARSSSTDMKNHRFDIGKGLIGNYYDFTLLNQNGDDFDLEMIHLEPVALKRKI